MRILHTSDWHLGKCLENINRMDEQQEFINELCSIADREDIQLVLVGGDVFDTYNPSAAAEKMFYEAVDRLSNGGSRAVVVIAGNHDNPDRLSAASSLASRKGIILLGYPASDAGEYELDGGFITMADSGPGWLELSVEGCEHNAVIIALPYPSEARLEQVLEDEGREEKLQKAYSEKVGDIFERLGKKFREDAVNLVVSHIFLMGGKESASERTLQVGGAMTVNPEVLPQNAHFVGLGHLHRPQKVKNAPCPAYYSGSPLAYSFSEAGYSKAVYVIDAVPGEEANIKEVCLSCGRPLKRWVAKNGMEEALRWCEEGRDRNAWIDLEVYTDRILTVEEQKRLREINPGIVNIRPVITSEDQDDISYENRENRKIDELFREFHRYRTGVEISDELMGVFLDVLNNTEDDPGWSEDTSTSIYNLKKAGG